MHKESNNSHMPHSTPVDTIIHLGAGRCSELDSYLASKPTRLLLVEADPQLAKTLQARTTDLSQVKIINKTVAGQTGPVTFHRYNLPDVNSLHKAAPGLLELFPGLKATQPLQTEAISPATLLQSLQLQTEQHNWLIIDLPGEELPTLKALQQADKLHLFDQLQLHCGHQALYENSEPAATILEWLQDQGFDLFQEDSSHDQDRPRWTLKRNKLQLRHRKLQQQLAQLTKDHNEQLNKHQTQIEQLTKARDEQAKLAAEHKAQLDKANQARANREKLAHDRLTQIDQLIKARDEQAKLAAEHKAQLDKANQARANQEKLAHDRLTQMDQLTKARDEQAKLAAEHKAQLDKANQTKTEQAHLAITHQQQRDQEKLRADTNQQQLAQNQEELEKLQQQLAELNHRLPMLDSEFIKAEAQIELIKDILIREKAF